ncbi:hypothetical protein HRbin33_01535 [bacterium HR33]|nr:hypothetical protein HRbin33_01535 [bacterium HR33]
MSRLHLSAVVAAITLCFAPDTPAAQTAESEDATAVPKARAVAVEGTVAIDGRLDDPAWRSVPAVTAFVQREPVEGAPPQERTEVRVLYDQSAIYIGAMLYERDPSRVRTQMVRRDQQGAYDYFEVSLDPNRDRRTGYRFRVSASGVQRDVYLYDDVREDEAWDAVWHSAVQHHDSGWSVEIRIPLSQLRYEASDAPQSWGVNFTRRRLAANELTDFALESRLRHGKVSLFGELEGLYLPKSSRRLEFRPFTLASARLGPAEPGNPFFDGSSASSRAGLDLRYGLGSAFSLDATIAPDFGQVEVDPAVINLTAFETFFQEKRPFFVEDAQVFDFSLSGRNRLFYTRRIGRAPQGRAPGDADFESIPTETTILGAAKLTGRLPSGLSLGALAAVTSREQGRAFNASTGRMSEFTVEPPAVFTAFRAKQDFRGGASQVGAILTAIRRELPEDGSFDFLTSDAYAVGVDFEHNWGGGRSRDWALWGFWAGSLVRGSPEALIRIQRASNHYFQRPDATRFSVDSLATRMSGYEWRLQFERRSARHWTGAVWLAEVSPGFEVNDVGFSTAGERLDGGARLSYQEITPGKVFRSYRINAFTFHNWRHEALDDPFSGRSWVRAHKRGAFNLSTNVEFLNYWGAQVELRYSPQSLSDVATRGGPLMIDPASTTLELRGNTDRRRGLSVEPSFSYQWRHLGGYSLNLSGEIGVRPAPGVEIEIEPRFQKELNPAQYVAGVSDPGYADTFGRRYIFADLERRELSMETRVDVALSPKVTIQLFAQPLLSSGDYISYKQLLRPESFDFDVFEGGKPVQTGAATSCVEGRTCRSGDTRYLDFNGDGSTDFSFAERDFTVRSLRINAVFRWEYRPGSTLFLVWQQSRRDSDIDGFLRFGRDLSQLWSAPAENRFIVKINYWIGL